MGVDIVRTLVEWVQCVDQINYGRVTTLIRFEANDFGSISLSFRYEHIDIFHVIHNHTKYERMCRYRTTTITTTTLQ